MARGRYVLSPTLSPFTFHPLPARPPAPVPIAHLHLSTPPHPHPPPIAIVLCAERALVHLPLILCFFFLVGRHNISIAYA